MEKEKEVRFSHSCPSQRPPQGEGPFEPRAGNDKRGASFQQMDGGTCPEAGSPGFLPSGALYDPDEHDRGGGESTAAAGTLRTDPPRILANLGGDAPEESGE